MYKPVSIISIEPIGLKTVCDIEVQKDHTYVANGILNHNSDPNAQQFPRLATNPDIRKCLVASTGRLYLMMDYSQAELRLMAHLSKCKGLLEAFAKGWDPHLSVACKNMGLNMMR